MHTCIPTFKRGVSMLISEEMIQLFKKTIVDQSREVTIAIIVGYLCFTLAYLIFKTIEKEIQREIDMPKRKWD